MSKAAFRQPRVIKIDAEALRKIEALPNISGSGNMFEWTDEADELLIKYYPLKRKEDLAAIFGVSEKTMRNRYRKLLKQQESATSD